MAILAANPIYEGLDKSSCPGSRLLTRYNEIDLWAYSRVALGLWNSGPMVLGIASNARGHQSGIGYGSTPITFPSPWAVMKL